MAPFDTTVTNSTLPENFSNEAPRDSGFDVQKPFGLLLAFVR